jgi:alanine racemase
MSTERASPSARTPARSDARTEGRADDRRTRAWIEVRAGALRRNYDRVRAAVGDDVGVIPMAKADAYGLGVDRLVPTLEPEEPLAWGVATVEEGVRLRALGVTRPVLVCAPMPPGSYADAVGAGLTVCLSSLEGLRLLDEAVARTGAAAAFHTEVDTGMGRAGFDWREAAVWGPVVAARHRPALRWAGCFTHFHSADDDPATLHVQWQRLVDVLSSLAHPREDFLVHAQNSAGALRAGRLASGGYRVGAVRPGIFLYGGAAGAGTPPPDPVAAVRARVVLVRDVSAGTSLGYGATYKARGPERWATLGIGYGDGLPRALGNRGHALIGGRRVPLVGRISMDMTVANISGVPGVEAGHVATLIGEVGDDRITVDEVAGLAGTISYEVLTGFTPRLPRIWVDDGGS